MMLTPDDQIEAQLGAQPMPEAAPPPEQPGTLGRIGQAFIGRGGPTVEAASDELARPDFWRNDIKPNFDAALTRALDLDNAGSDGFVHHNAYAPVIEAINAGRPWNDRVPNPYAFTPLSIFDDATQLIRGLPLSERGIKDLVWQRVSELRTANPGLAGNIPANEAELESDVLAGQKADADWADTLARNSGPLGRVAQFAGGAIGGLADPINLAGSAIGFPETSAARSAGSELLRLFVREGAINGAIDLAGLPGRMQRYAAIGEPYTAEQAAEEVGGAALLGGIVPTGLRGASMLAGLERRPLIDAFDAAVPDPSPTARTARALVEDDAVRAEQNPYTKDPAGEDLHRVNLMDTMRALDAGRVDLVPHMPADGADVSLAQHPDQALPESELNPDHTGGGFHTEAEHPPVASAPKPPKEENLRAFSDPAKNPEPFRQQSQDLAREISPAPKPATDIVSEIVPPQENAKPEFGALQPEIDALRSLDQKTAIAELPQLGLLGDGHTIKTVTTEIERQARAVERLRGCVTGEG